MNFLKSGAAKVLLYLALAAIPIGWGYYVANGKDGQITELKEQVSKQTGQIEGLKLDVKARDGDIATLKNQLQDQKIVKETEDKLRETQGKLTEAEKLIDQKVADINKKYDALPKNDVNAQARKRELSSERVKGLWLSYCLAYPKNVRCVQAAPAAAASAAAQAASK